MNVFEQLRSFAESKIARLDRFYDQIQAVELVLSKEGDDKIAEMRVRARVGGSFEGRVKHDDFYAAIDLLLDKMTRQLKKQKDKVKLRHHKSGRRPQVEPSPAKAEEEDLESYDEVIENMEL